MFLAVTAAQRFKTNVYTAMAVAAALVYPAIVTFASTESAISFFGIPLVTMNYIYSVLPIVVGIWSSSSCFR